MVGGQAPVHVDRVAHHPESVKRPGLVIIVEVVAAARVDGHAVSFADAMEGLVQRAYPQWLPDSGIVCCFAIK